MPSRLEQRITAFLRHPAVMAAKRAARDAWWSLRGLTLRRPAPSGEVRSLLFICKGNICRSPFAAHLAARLLSEEHRDVRSLSAGFHTSQGNRSPAHAVDAGRAHGVRLDEHRPTALSDDLLRESDLAIVFELAHLTRLTRQYPQHRHRFVLLPLFRDATRTRPGYARYNIADPFGHGRDVFDDCYAATADAVRALLSALPRAQASPSAQR